MAEQPHSNRTLERAAAILDSLETGPKLATQIASDIGLSLSTTHRMALAMVETEFLTRRADGTFELGRRLVQSERNTISYTILKQLADDVKESVQLWIRSGDERVCRISFDAPHELRVTLPVGSRLPLPAGSAGALLAGSPEAMESIAAFGWYQSEGRRVAGVGSVSAPIIVDDEMVGAVCVVAPLSRLDDHIGEVYGAATVQTANKIAEQLLITRANS